MLQPPCRDALLLRTPPIADVLGPDVRGLLGAAESEEPSPRIAIIGAGPTGLYTLRHLMRHAQRRLHVDLFERGPAAGPGMPYAEANGTPALLANIAGRELPPVLEPIHVWLSRQPDDLLQTLGLRPDEIDAFTFFPRLALGAYFTAQFADVVAGMRAMGHAVELHRRHDVCDIQPEAGGSRLVWESPEGRGGDRYDCVVIATGHTWQDGKTATGVRLLSPWPAERLARLPGQRICILGTALSAIDAAVAIACARGTFSDDAGRLGYKAHRGRDGFLITLASRKGLLPAADYWYELPLPDLTNLAAITPGPNLFERAFGALLRDLAEADPVQSERWGGLQATPEALAEGWFAPRRAADPFAWAERNLQAAIAGYRARRSEPLQIALLRAHELFEPLLLQFADAELERFHATLRPVFADNYASVPHLSVQRLLALSRAGHLQVVRLGEDAEITPAPGGKARVTAEGLDGQTEPFDTVIDARGQRSLRLDDLGFPTLTQALAAIRPNRRQPRFADFQLKVPGGGPIHCLALPVLLHRRPFVQGLVNADQMGHETAIKILDSLSNTKNKAKRSETGRAAGPIPHP